MLNGTWNLGKYDSTDNLSREVIITNADNVYCIEYGQLLTGNMTYDRVARIVIRGWKATFYDEDGNEVGQTDHYYNNRLAAILTPNSYFPYFPEDCFRNRSEYTVGYGREQGQIVDWIEDDERKYSDAQLGLYQILNKWLNGSHWGDGHNNKYYLNKCRSKHE